MEHKEPIIQLPVGGWGGRWWQAPQMSCACMAWGGKSKDMWYSTEDQPQLGSQLHERFTASAVLQRDLEQARGCSHTHTLHSTGWFLVDARRMLKSKCPAVDEFKFAEGDTFMSRLKAAGWPELIGSMVIVSCRFYPLIWILISLDFYLQGCCAQA